MVIAPLSLHKDYWKTLRVNDQDIEFLYSRLLEVEEPQSTQQLVQALISDRVRKEKQSLEKQHKAGGSVYYPKEHYTLGQVLQFPQFNWQAGKIIAIRPGINPEYAAFEVMEVEMQPSGEKHLLASGIEKHLLNEPVRLNEDDPLLNPDAVYENFGEDLEAELDEVLEANDDLVRIAGEWFPRALLVDINVGHLNLAEAVLDMMGGGPMSTCDLMQQIDLPSDAEAKLNEFSLNLAMQEDDRFDEVGPTGETLWYLYRLEPDPVREAPTVLRYTTNEITPTAEVITYFDQFDRDVIDDLDAQLNPVQSGPVKEAVVSLIYPHWRAGTLPLTGSLTKLFPTALESPRIQFTFVDSSTGQKFSGWVVRPLHYVYGLRKWFESQNLIPGSLVKIQRGAIPGEMMLIVDKKRASREWLRTASLTSTGEITFAMQKQVLSCAIDERMAIVVNNLPAFDENWEKSGRQRGALAQIVRQVMREMAKLNPQNHVHIEELYAGVNLLRRCPPSALLSLLLESAWAKHLGNLYFQLDESASGDAA